MYVFKMLQKGKSNVNVNQTDNVTVRSDTELNSNIKTTALLVISLFINGVVTDEVSSISVKKGDSVTLYTDPTEIQRDDLIDWRFGDQQDRIAKLNKEANLSTFSNFSDGRFNGRLKLNNQTGDLTITDITTQHTGVYTLEINGELTKLFNISVSVDVNDKDQSSSKSSGVVAGLCVFLLVLAFALALAIFLYRRLSRTTRQRVSKDDETFQD